MANSARDKHKARSYNYSRREVRRTMGAEGQGSSGDVRDRFRDVYKPGARETPKPGLMSPAEAIRRLTKKRKPRVP